VNSGVIGPDGSYQVEGIGSSNPGRVFDRSVVDFAETITDDESFAASARLIREEGLLVGGSAGTALAAALRVAQRDDVSEPVVVLLPDAWDRYRSKPWMQALGAATE
jgi:cysteine synthase